MHDQLLIFKIKIMLFSLKYSGVKNRPIHLTVDFMITEMFNTMQTCLSWLYITLHILQLHYSGYILLSNTVTTVKRSRNFVHFLVEPLHCQYVMF